MEKYELESEFGVTVDYWANSMQMFTVCGDLFSERECNAAQGQTEDIGGNAYDREMDSCSNERHIILKEDLMVTDEGKTCLFLRFKNCTGNIINLSDNQTVDDPDELAQVELALSIDHLYKKSRSRTIKQAITMVLRWRTISLGYYDYQIKRRVYPMTK